jgi:hypothetical protein
MNYEQAMAAQRAQQSGFGYTTVPGSTQKPRDELIKANQAA